MAGPVVVKDDHISLKPEQMKKEAIYHCLFGDKVLLFFKDAQDFLNCYEIEAKEIVEKVKSAPDGDIKVILEDYIQNRGLHRPG